MKVNNFNPVRLKSARLYRGKTIDVLAKETNVNKKDILAFEESKYLPVLENSAKLANALNFPQEYFYKKDNLKVLVDGTHFSAPGSIPRVEEVAYREKLIMTHKICTFIEEYIELPSLNLPTSTNRSEDAEAIANKLRVLWNLGEKPIANLGEIMEENGILISSMNHNRKRARSFTQKQSINGDLKYIVCLGDDGNCAPRRNFDLAYELGYIVCNALNIPPKKFSKDEFACALLLPKESFFEDLKNPTDLDSYVDLKKKYVAPISVMLYRANQMEMLGYKPYNNLLREMQKQGWADKEPLDDAMKVSSDSLLKAAIDALIERDIVSKGNISESLSDVGIDIYEDDINQLMGLNVAKVQSKNPRNKRRK